MQSPKYVGAKAPTLKYDLLTALNLIGLHGSPLDQVSTQRLSTLITARYNWRRDQLSVGQPDMARMFGVTERTVKRQVKHWVEEGYLHCTRNGVRGRVGAYCLCTQKIFELSKPYWAMVGPDFEERMQDMIPRETRTVIPFRPATMEEAPTPSTTPWGAICDRLRGADPNRVVNWLNQLSFVTDDGAQFVIEAQSRFVAQYVETHLGADLAAAIDLEVGGARRLVVTTAAAVGR